MEAETFLKKDVLSKLSKTSKAHILKQSWESDLDSDEAFAELEAISNNITTKLKASLEIVTALFTVMEVLEILIDCLTFADLYEAENWFDGGVIAGKGLVNAAFTLYYIIMEYTREPGTWQKFDWETAGGIF